MITIPQHPDQGGAANPDALKLFKRQPGYTATSSTMTIQTTGWQQLGMDAGFTRVDTLFTTGDRICAMFRYTSSLQ